MHKHVIRLETLEKQIWEHIRNFSSDNLLLSIHNVLKNEIKLPGNNNKKIEILPFIAAGMCSFAIRFSNPNRHINKNATLFDISELARLVADYLTCDPVGVDEKITQEFHQSNPISLLLRTVGNQFPFDPQFYGFVGQPLLLYGEIISDSRSDNNIAAFDFENKFVASTGLQLSDFISIGFSSWSFFSSAGNTGITRNYYEKARLQGLNIPDDEGISLMLDCISADSIKFRKKYEQMKQQDRSLRMYDFNPLLSYPILRPWKHSCGKSMSEDRIIAPLPNLIPYRISTGIYYEMFNQYREEFSRFFGHLFEIYVGRLLSKCVCNLAIFSEKDIRKTYPESLGKVPDFTIIDGSTALILESKATRFSLKALGTGADAAIKDSLKQVLKGLKQLYDFHVALRKKTKGLAAFDHCTSIKAVLITYETLYLVNTGLFKLYLDDLLLERFKISNFEWHILSVKELEVLQPFFAAGVSMAETMDHLKNTSFNNVITLYRSKIGLSYQDSVLYQYDLKMYDHLNMPRQLSGARH